MMTKSILAALAAVSALASTPAMSATGLVDGGFESQAASVSSYCYFGFSTPGGAACDTGAWSANPEGGSGFQYEGNNPWPGNPTPDGSFYAFVQGGGVLQQIFSVATTGLYSFDWLESGRTLGGYDGDHYYEVFIDGAKIGSGTTTDNATWLANGSSAVKLNAGQSYTLAFKGTYSGDTTSFIDAVSMNAVPEPATWAMMIVGMGGIGASMRRRPRVRMVAA